MAAHQYGLGEPTGVELQGERPGTVPSTEWKRKVRKEAWYPGETISVAIGQGYVTVTPLQMAAAMGAVANGGTLYRPRLVRAIRERSTGQLRDIPPVERGEVPMRENSFAILQNALQGVVTHGTGGRAKSKFVDIAGKTGTAQTVGARPNFEKGQDIPKQFRDHAWFVAFAPVLNPRVAIAVIVESTGHGGTFAAPIAILSSALLSTSGVFIALLVTRTTFNVSSFMGMIMVVGIVAKNGILLLDADQKLRAAGASVKDAMLQASRRRLRPIVMTALATIAGMLPLAFALGAGSQMLQPLAIAVIGGILVSMVLSLIITPAVHFYLSHEPAR